MSIRNLKDGSKKPWLCECYPQGRGGKRIRKKFATKGEAAAFERFTMNEIDDKPWLGEKTDHRRLSDLVEEWWVLHGSSMKTGALTKALLIKTANELGNPIASTLTANQYLQYRSQRISYHASQPDLVISNTTKNIELKSIKAMFNVLIKYNAWKLPSPVADIDLIRTPEREMAFLTIAQCEELLNKILKDNSPAAKQIYLVIKICLSTGCRVGEAHTLRRSQLLPNKLLFTDTKSKRNRAVPIDDDLYDEILKLSISKTDVFNVRYGAIFECVKRHLPPLPRGQATHVCRHTFASHFMMRGGNIITLQKILGHSKIEQTMVYAHLSPDHLADAIALNPLSKKWRQ